jgi:hypothetical protein
LVDLLFQHRLGEEGRHKVSVSYALISPISLFLGYDKIGTLLFDKLLIPETQANTRWVLQAIREREGERVCHQISDIWLPVSRIWTDFKPPSLSRYYKELPKSEDAIQVFDSLLDERMRQREETAKSNGRTWDKEAAALSYFQGIKDMLAAFADARASLNIIRRVPCPIVAYPEALRFLRIENQYLSEGPPFRFVDFFEIEIPNFLRLRYGEILALRQSPHLGTFKKWLNQICVPELIQAEDFLNRAREQMGEATRRLALETQPKPGRSIIKVIVSVVPIPYFNPFGLSFGIGDVIKERRKRKKYGSVYMWAQLEEHLAKTEEEAKGN